MNENKNKEKLASFIKYCLDHPEEKFWQALRNWSNYYFIFTWRPRQPLRLNNKDGNYYVDGLEELSKLGLEDTFYFD